MRILFSVTALVGAFLLFLVEPMFARMLLPFLGGAPAVWNTCLVFYQCALLVGYLYAHGVSRRTPRQQVMLQVVLLVIGAIALPIAVRGPGTPPASSNPIGWVLAILLLSLGLPFTVLATTGPLLQRWFTLARRRADDSPYSLFAASNVGSFVALFGYPILVEPSLRLQTQSLWWTGGYAVYAVLMLGCAALTWRADGAGVAATAAPAAPPVPLKDGARAGRRSTGTPSRIAAETSADDVWADRLRWLGLAAVPASLMMSVTTFISTDVASIPLLWMMPLAIYLLTFVLAFAERRWYPPRLITWLFPVAVVLIVGLVIAPPVFPLPMIALHLTSFAVIALACHAELARQRPDVGRLTEFYLWLSAGGAVGGLLNALVAPLIFVNPFEYPLAALSACLLLPRHGEPRTEMPSRLREVAGQLVTLLPVLLVIAMLWGVQRFSARIPNDTFTRYLIIVGPPLVAAFFLRTRPLRMGIALAMVAVAGGFVRFDNRVPIHLERSFFGVHRVVFSGRERVLLSGTTNHGAQAVNAALKCEPLTYYSRGGPIGQLFASLAEGARPLTHVGVVGLGTASMAAYAAPGQQWTFFEINPAVERLARDPEYFTYLRDCAPQAKVVIGDARLMLANQPDGTFNVLVLDAFSSDSIPVHLMTREAIQLYARTLAPGGLLAVHISNRYLELGPVVGATARAAGLTSIVQLHVPTSAQLEVSSEISLSRWVLIARNERDFGALPNSGNWHTLDDETGPVWTDDYSNVVGVMRW